MRFMSVQIRGTHASTLSTISTQPSILCSLADPVVMNCVEPAALYFFLAILFRT